MVQIYFGDEGLQLGPPYLLRGERLSASWASSNPRVRRSHVFLVVRALIAWAVLLPAFLRFLAVPICIRFGHCSPDNAQKGVWSTLPIELGGRGKMRLS